MSNIGKNQGTVVPSEVHWPFGERFKTVHLTTAMLWIGNDIAEGHVHPSQFWPQLARCYLYEIIALKKEFVRLEEIKEKLDYSKYWIDRWLEDTMPEYYEKLLDEESASACPRTIAFLERVEKL